MKTAIRFAFFIVAISIAGCGGTEQAVEEEPAPIAVQTGAEVLLHSDFATLQGKKVGLIANQTTTVGEKHLADWLHEAPDVELVALFGPEHGLRGEADAGEKVADGVDDRTGVPVYSLYGDTRKPSAEMLAGMDILIFDIQDIGARFYTFIYTMGLAMQAAAEAGIDFMVLDRPNPLGGEYVAGFVREPGFESFVSDYPIPVQHGLTIGELAMMVRDEGFYDGLQGLDLTVVAMQGWQRHMQWPDTDLPWQQTSPNIPDFETALIYPGTCFFEAVEASEGRGTYQPFKQIGAPWADSLDAAATLNTAGLPGVTFAPISFVPASIEGMASNPGFLGEEIQGVRLAVSDPKAFRPVEAGIHILTYFYNAVPETERASFVNERWLGLLAGTDRLQSSLEAGLSAEAIIASWQDEVDMFKQQRQAYLLYE